MATSTPTATDRVAEAGRYGVPAAYVGADVSHFDARTRTGFPEEPADVLIRGPVGVGKTYLSVALGRWWWPKIKRYDDEGGHASFRWVAVPEFVARIRAGGPEEEYAELLRLGSRHVLVLDDIGAEKQTDYSGAALYTLLSGRVNNRLPTVVTTNLSLAEVHARDPRLASRLSEFLEIRLVGEDRRAERGRERADHA